MFWRQQQVHGAPPLAPAAGGGVAAAMECARAMKCTMACNPCGAAMTAASMLLCWNVELATLEAMQFVCTQYVAECCYDLRAMLIAQGGFLSLKLVD
jgi:hypothetical protein